MFHLTYPQTRCRTEGINAPPSIRPKNGFELGGLWSLGSPLGRAVGSVLGDRDGRSRLLIVLTCYLDDSGTHSDCPVITMAGYIGFLSGWLDFEKAAKEIYTSYGINVFHARDFHATDNDFKGWSRITKQSYTRQICEAARTARALEMGVSVSVLKSAYKQKQLETGLSKTMSPYGYSFSIIMDHLLRDEVLKKIVGEQGVDISFVIEGGNNNDNNILNVFNEVRNKYRLEHKLKSISFMEKDSSHALQLADFFAFYSRRHVEESERNNGVPPAIDFINSQLVRGIHLIDIVATNFFVQKPTA